MIAHLSESWLLLGLLCAFFIGLYDIAKKGALTGNAIPLVLPLTSAVTAIGLIAIRTYTGQGLELGKLGALQHLQIGAKSLLVTTLWFFTSTAVKHLPLSISAPLRSSSPLFTIAGAVLFLSERPDPQQWIGIIVTLAGYWGFSLAGRLEGINFTQNRWVAMMLFGTMLASLSGMYDKILIQRWMLEPGDVQLWFTLYTFALQGVVAAVWLGVMRKRWRAEGAGAPRFKEFIGFEWRLSIPAVGLFLLIADRLWFEALHVEGALVGVLTVIRRAGVLISFLAGGLILKEKNRRKKGVALLVVLAGLALLVV